MKKLDDDNPIDDFASELVRRKARQLTRLTSLGRQDREDLEQELFLCLLRKLELFDDQRGDLGAYLTAIIERCALNFLRNQRAAKRNAVRVSSLSVHVDAGEGEPAPFASVIPDSAHDFRLTRDRLSDEELVSLAIDIEEVLARLPPHWQELAARLKTRTKTEAARDMKMPRSTLYGWVRSIRRQFEKRGFEK